MKKKIVISFLILIAAFVLYATLFTTVHHKEIVINAPTSRVHYQLASIKSISKWYMPFAITDTNLVKITGNNKVENNSDSLTIVNVSNLSALYRVSENGSSKNIVFDVMADSVNHSRVTVSYETTLWNTMLGSDPIVANATKSLQHLKEYFEDTKKMYGYEMELIELTDTTFLFTSKVVANSVKRAAIKSTYESLIQYAKEKNMDYNGTRIFYSSAFGNDSTHLFISIGITNTSNASYTGDYVLKKMPYHGHLLTAFYQGSFGNVHKAIDAMDQFKADNGMTTMAIPFIKLITEGVDFDDSQIIQARAYYPVF